MKRSLNIFIALLVVDLIGLGILWWGGMALQQKKADQTKLREDIAAEEQRGSKLLTIKRTLDNAKKDHAELSRFLYDTTDEAQIQFISEIPGIRPSSSRCHGQSVAARAGKYRVPDETAPSSPGRPVRSNTILKMIWVPV